MFMQPFSDMRKTNVKRKTTAWIVFSALLGSLFLSLYYKVGIDNRDDSATATSWPSNETATGYVQSTQTAEARDTRDVDQTILNTATDVDSVIQPKPSMWDQLVSVPAWELIAEHWPKAIEGNADSLLIVHDIMSTCAVYRKRFDGKDIVEVQAEFAANNDPALYDLNEAVWQKCGPVYDNWDQYNGWKTMFEEAANFGQPYAMVRMGHSLLSNADTLTEGVALIESALLTEDFGAVAEMKTIYYRAGIDSNVSYGWLVAACELGLDCSANGAYMAGTCGRFSETCGIHESVRDYLIRELGDYGYEIAKQRGAKIANAIVTGRIDDLEIESDLDKSTRYSQ